MNNSMKILDSLYKLIRKEKENINEYRNDVNLIEIEIKKSQMFENDPIVKKYLKKIKKDRTNFDIAKDTNINVLSDEMIHEYMDKITLLNSKIEESQNNISTYNDVIKFVKLSSSVDMEDNFSITEIDELDNESDEDLSKGTLAIDIEELPEQSKLEYKDKKIKPEPNCKSSGNIGENALVSNYLKNNIEESINKLKIHIKLAQKFVELDSKRTIIELQFAEEKATEIINYFDL